MASVKPLILVVEDDPKTVQTVRLYLEHAGYAVVASGDGREALARAQAEPRPDLVVLDLMLPGTFEVLVLDPSAKAGAK